MLIGEFPTTSAGAEYSKAAYSFYPAPRESLQIVEWSRSLLDGAFADTGNARLAHEALDVNAFIDRAGRLKSQFTNHPETKRVCQALITALGADPDLTYFDLPRLRIAPPGNYLTSGVSYAYKAHRDTWYAHPTQLVNFWAPIFDSEATTVMSMYLDHFGRPLKNTSRGWDYDEWVANARYAAVENVYEEKRRHPVPLERLDDAPEVRIVQNAGDLMLFSACHLHATAPNESGQIRYSFDLRTINIEDLRRGCGPRNLDGKATGTTLCDFLRVSDLSPFDPDSQDLVLLETAGS